MNKPLYILCGAAHYGKVGKVDPLYFYLSHKKICQGRYIESHKWVETFGTSLYKCYALDKIYHNKTEGESNPPTIEKYVDVIKTYYNAIKDEYKGVIETKINTTTFVSLSHDFIDKLHSQLKPHFDVKGLVVYTKEYEQVLDRYNCHFPTFAVNPYKITDDLWDFLNE
tara:strand:+ start:65 stop:568 length:504 start_codon:yes stop_codon:yes gene_type:complete